MLQYKWERNVDQEEFQDAVSNRKIYSRMSSDGENVFTFIHVTFKPYTVAFSLKGGVKKNIH